jgi:hypothetical protein
MDIDEPGWPLIDDFFERLARGRAEATVRRYARVRHRFYDFLDVDDMSEWLQPDEVVLLALEREFLSEGAVWNLFGLEGLLRCIPGFVAESQLPTSAAEARMQVSVMKRFIDQPHVKLGVTRDKRESWLVARRAIGLARHQVETKHLA